MNDPRWSDNGLQRPDDSRSSETGEQNADSRLDDTQDFLPAGIQIIPYLLRLKPEHAAAGYPDFHESASREYDRVLKAETEAAQRDGKTFPSGRISVVLKKLTGDWLHLLERARSAVETMESAQYDARPSEVLRMKNDFNNGWNEIYRLTEELSAKLHGGTPLPLAALRDEVGGADMEFTRLRLEREAELYSKARDLPELEAFLVLKEVIEDSECLRSGEEIARLAGRYCTTGHAAVLESIPDGGELQLRKRVGEIRQAMDAG